MVPKNLSNTGRAIRLLAGIALLVWSFFQMSLVLLIAALFCIFEAAMSWCVVYQMLGINHCPLKKRK